MRKNIAIVFALLLISAAGFAQVPTSGNIYVGYALDHGNTGLTDNGTLNGWEASVEGKVVPHLGIVADVSQTYGTLTNQVIAFPFGVDEHNQVTSYLVGPRVSFGAGKFRPFVHVLIGAAHLHESVSGVGFVNAETDFADALGGGLDYHLIPRVSWRLQLDDLQTHFHGVREDDTRFTTGLALHF